MVAVTFLPPTPAAVGVLETVEPVEAGFHHPIKLLQVFLLFRMGRGGVRRLDPAEEAAHHVFGFQSEVLKSLSSDDRGQEPAHRLLGAAVRIINKIRQRIEHGHGHARSHLHDQARRIRLSFLWQIKFHGDVVGKVEALRKKQERV